MTADPSELIAQTISAHRLLNGRCESCGEPSKHESRHMADAVLAALQTGGWQQVQLPEPIERETDDQTFTDFPGVGLYVPVVFDAHPGEVQIRAGAWCDEPLSVDEARELATSILGAAAAAERESNHG